MTPAADAFVRGGQYAANPYGLNGTIEVKNYIADLTRVGHVKFDISTLPTTVASATLRLHGKLAGTVAPLTVSVHSAANANWTDAGITWSNQPAQTGATLGTFVVNSATASWHELDLTNCVNAAKAAGQSSISLRLTGPNGNTAVIEFSSREASTVANRPQLVVVADASAPTPPAAPTNLTAVAASPTQLNLTWDDQASDEAGYLLEYGASGAFPAGGATGVVSLPANATSYVLGGLTPGIAYHVRVRATNAGGASANSNVASATTQLALSPTDLQHGDIGGPAIVGDASYSAGAAGTGSSYALQGGGADVFGTSDQFHFAYYPLGGDGTIIARVASIQNTHASAKAGVMVRESLAPNARNAFMNVKPTAGVEFSWRTSAGGSTGYTNAAGLGAPYWVRLTRVGDVVTASRSADGAVWTVAGTATFAGLAGTVHVGLAVTAHDNAKLATGAFDNVTIAGHVPEPIAPSGLTATVAAAASPAQVNLAWTDHAGNETGYRVERSSDGGATFATLPAAAALAAGTTTFGDATVAAGVAYNYRVRATGPTIAGVQRDSAWSNAASATTPPSAAVAPAAPTDLSATATSPTQVDLAWTDNAGDEGGYRVERSTDGGATFTALAGMPLAVNATIYSDTTVAAGTPYRYRVIATGAAGAPDSAASNMDDATTPAALSISIGGDASVAEGATYTLSLSASGYGSDVIDHWAVDWDGAGPLVAETVMGNPGSVTHVFPDGLNPATDSTVTARAYLAGDTTGTTAAHKSVTVSNAAPIVAIGGAPTTWAAGQMYNLTASATDVGLADAAAGFTYAWSQAVDGGTPTIVTGPSFSVTPNTLESYVLTLTATDKDGASSVADTLSFTVNPAVATTAVDDELVFKHHNGPVRLSVLANDLRDPGITLDISGITQPANGTVVILSGSPDVLTYVPSTGFVGTDTFTYTIDDGHGGVSTATVSVAVQAGNGADAVDSVRPGAKDYTLGDGFIIDPNATFTPISQGNYQYTTTIPVNATEPWSYGDGGDDVLHTRVTTGSQTLTVISTFPGDGSWSYYESLSFTRTILTAPVIGGTGITQTETIIDNYVFSGHGNLTSSYFSFTADGSDAVMGSLAGPVTMTWGSLGTKYENTTSSANLTTGVVTGTSDQHGGQSYSSSGNGTYSYETTGGSVTGTTNQSSSWEDTYQYSATNGTYSQQQSDGWGYSGSGSYEDTDTSAGPSTGSVTGSFNNSSTISGTINEGGSGSSTGQYAIVSQLVSGTWIKTGSGSTADSNVGHWSSAGDGAYTRSTSDTNGTLSVSGSKGVSSESSWNSSGTVSQTLVSSGTWSIVSGDGDSSGGTSDSWHYNGGGSYSDISAGLTGGTILEDATNGSSNNYSIHSDWVTGSWVQSGTNTNSTLDRGNWSSSGSSPYSRSTSDDNGTLSVAGNKGVTHSVGWIDQSSGTQSLAADGAWSNGTGAGNSTRQTNDEWSYQGSGTYTDVTAGLTSGTINEGASNKSTESFSVHSTWNDNGVTQEGKTTDTTLDKGSWHSSGTGAYANQSDPSSASTYAMSTSGSKHVHHKTDWNTTGDATSTLDATGAWVTTTGSDNSATASLSMNGEWSNGTGGTTATKEVKDDWDYSGSGNYTSTAAGSANPVTGTINEGASNGATEHYSVHSSWSEDGTVTQKGKTSSTTLDKGSWHSSGTGEYTRSTNGSNGTLHVTGSRFVKHATDWNTTGDATSTLDAKGQWVTTSPADGTAAAVASLSMNSDWSDGHGGTTATKDVSNDWGYNGSGTYTDIAAGVSDGAINEGASNGATDHYSVHSSWSEDGVVIQKGRATATTLDKGSWHSNGTGEYTRSTSDANGTLSVTGTKDMAHEADWKTDGGVTSTLDATGSWVTTTLTGGSTTSSLQMDSDWSISEGDGTSTKRVSDDWQYEGGGTYSDASAGITNGQINEDGRNGSTHTYSVQATWAEGSWEKSGDKSDTSVDAGNWSSSHSEDRTWSERGAELVGTRAVTHGTGWAVESTISKTYDSGSDAWENASNTTATTTENLDRTESSGSGSYTRGMGDLLTVTGTVNASSAQSKSTAFTATSTLGDDGTYTYSGTGTGDASTSQSFGYSGGGTYSDSPSTHTSATYAGDGYTGNSSTMSSGSINQSLQEGGHESSTSSVLTVWVLDPNGAWRASETVGSDEGDTSASFSYSNVSDSTMRTQDNLYFSQSTLESLTEFTTFESSSNSEQSSYHYSRELTATTDEYGQTTTSGSGYGSGSANGQRNYELDHGGTVYQKSTDLTTGESSTIAPPPGAMDNDQQRNESFDYSGGWSETYSDGGDRSGSTFGTNTAEGTWSWQQYMYADGDSYSDTTGTPGYGSFDSPNTPQSRGIWHGGSPYGTAGSAGYGYGGSLPAAGAIGSPPDVTQPPPVNPNAPVKSSAPVQPDEPVPVCFAAGTLVLMADGTHKPIEQIEVGEMVLAASDQDPEGPVTPCRVAETYRRGPSPLWFVTVAGEVIRCTGEHPFYVKGKGWTHAKDLTEGDEMRTPERGSVTVESVVLSDVIEVVFNLNIDGHHTYFIVRSSSASAVLVHNADYPLTPGESMFPVLSGSLGHINPGDRLPPLYDPATGPGPQGDRPPEPPFSTSVLPAWIGSTVDFVVDLLPLASSVKSAVQAGTGVNPVTGEELTVSERQIEGAMVLGGLIPGGKLIGKGLKKFGGAVWDAAKPYVTKLLNGARGNAPHNAANFAKFKDQLRAAMTKPHVTDPELSRYMDELYRDNAQIGSGSTAAAVRLELATGGTVGGRTHSQKARDMSLALEKWLKNNPGASPGDRAAAENVLQDMLNALNGN
ncbi:MAG TPA: fibronectin type III domain-containing protein [Tepidisphaeraceae bacterium]|nr:fibronectin type III domain-containing protein [Tepidisphaeraceae bacterium]